MTQPAVTAAWAAARALDPRYQPNEFAAARRRVWDAVAVDGGLLEKILIADGTPEEQAKIRLPPALTQLKPAAAPDAWPSARRRLRLSFAVPAALGLVDVAEGRQGLLEAGSTADRLRQVERALTRRAAHLRGILSQKLQKRREN